MVKAKLPYFFALSAEARYPSKLPGLSSFKRMRRCTSISSAMSEANAFICVSVKASRPRHHLDVGEMQVRLPVPGMPGRGDEIAQYADMSFDVGLASSDWTCNTVSSLSARKGHHEPGVVPRQNMPKIPFMAK